MPTTQFIARDQPPKSLLPKGPAVLDSDILTDAYIIRCTDTDDPTRNPFVSGMDEVKGPRVSFYPKFTFNPEEASRFTSLEKAEAFRTLLHEEHRARIYTLTITAESRRQ